MSVSPEVTPLFPRELTIRSRRGGGSERVLPTEDTRCADCVVRTFDMPGLVGEAIAAGRTPTTVAVASGDTGLRGTWSVQASFGE